MSATKLVQACLNEQFPDLATMTKYGLDGHGGTNPVAIFRVYRDAVKNGGLTESMIDKYMSSGKLNELLLEQTSSVKYLDCYEAVLQKGGIKLSSALKQRECGHCQLCAVHQDDVCSNCCKPLKQ